MAVLRLNGSVQVINSPVPEFPLAVRREFAEAVSFEYSKATGGLPTDLPIGEITTPQAIVVSTDTAVDVDLGTVTLEAGGFIVIYAGVPGTNPPTVDNTSGSSAKIRGIALGS